ncbi:MAG: formimidoylglutamate deiminase [Crocinitomicaceae bacterium]
MKVYKIDYLVQKDVVLKDAFLEVGKDGKIIGIQKEYNGDYEHLRGLVLPGFQNAHSHCFQYAMAGMAELHSTTNEPDDFWSWRDSMYKIALQISPEQLESVAMMLYSEMLRMGYTEVAEFHYLHHDKDGKAYSNLSEMGERLMSAAQKTGIKITLIPIFYQKGGFGKEASEGQRRFLSPDSENYLKLVEASRKSAENYSKAKVVKGIHSLRAVDEKGLQNVLNTKEKDLPLHIHISEQLKEVEECKSYYGARPVQWLLDNFEVDSNYHLVHATHLVESEIQGIANSGANVVLCPSTEGNLGDGIFPLRAFQEMGGKWSIGTDSHIGLQFMEELRLLDYGQRLISHKRNTFYSKQQGNPGFYGLSQAICNGRKAMGVQSSNFFEIGHDFDAVVVDMVHPLMFMSEPELKLSTLLYSMDQSSIKEVYVAGERIITNGMHEQMDSIWIDFAKTLKDLGFRN